jgi:hypothetical protein
VETESVNDECILRELSERLRAQGLNVHVVGQGVGHVSLRIGAKDGAVMGLRVQDPSRPAFIVSYPKLVVARNGEHHVQDVTAENVLVEGVEWVARALATDGVVRPEFE